MKLQVKNFSSKQHRLEVVTQDLTVCALYKKYDFNIGDFFTDKIFIENYNKDNYTEKLAKLLKRVEDYSGLELIKPEMQIAS